MIFILIIEMLGALKSAFSQYSVTNAWRALAASEQCNATHSYLRFTDVHAILLSGMPTAFVRGS
jgi:hypothetical protein